MQESANADFPQNSYSALLHGPDTPPFDPQPAWDPRGEEGHHCAEVINWPSKNFTEKDQGSSNKSQGRTPAFHNEHPMPSNIKYKRNLPMNVYESDVSNLEDRDVQEPISATMGFQVQYEERSPAEREQLSEGSKVLNCQSSLLNARSSQHPPNYECNTGKHFTSSSLLNARSSQHPPNYECNTGKHFTSSFDQGSTPNQNDGPSFVQSQQHILSTGLEREDVNCKPYPYWEHAMMDHPSNVSIPSRMMSKGHVPNGLDVQQYSTWSTMHSQTSGAYVGQTQHAAHVGYSQWDANAWHEGHPSMHQGSYFPHGSSYGQMRPNNQMQVNWQTQSAGTFVDSYSQCYSDGYFFHNDSAARRDHNFSSNREIGPVIPPPYDPYCHYYQESHTYPPPNQSFSRIGTSVMGTGCSGNFSQDSGPQDPSSEKNQESSVLSGGQMQPQQLQTSSEKGHCVNQLSIVMDKDRQEKTAKSIHGYEDSSLCEESVELEGPQVKRLRESSYADNCHQSSDRMPEKFSSQLHMGSMLLENSGVDCNSSSQSLSDVHSHMIYTSIREAAPQNCGFESRVESSHAVAGAQQRFCAPSNCPPLWTNNPVQTDMSASLIPGQMLTRNHARSLTPVCSAPPQSGYNSGKNPVHNPQQIPEYCLRNGIVPGGCRDEYAFSRTNGAMGSAQNQVSAHLVLQRAGNQTQRSNPANFPALSKSSQQLGIPTMATENAFPDKGLSSSDSNHEIAVSQPAMLKPSDVAEGSSYMNGADLKYQNINRDPYAYSNLGQNYSFASSNLHPEVVNRKMPYPIAGAHLDHLQSQVQAPDMKSFGHTKTGVVETAAQLRGFGRPASENFYPPSHFQSHPLSHQRIRGTMGRSQDQVPPETWASGSSGPYMPVRGTKVTPIKSLNYHENAGFAGEGAVYNSATAGSGIGRGSNFTDSTQAYQHSALLTEAGYVNRHQPNSNLFSANTSQMAKPKSVPSHMYSTSITFESQGLTRPTPISGDIKDAQEDSLAIANLTNTNGDQYLNARHDYLYRAGAEYNNFGDGQFSALGSTIVQQVHQQALKANLQGPFPAQTKKRKKSMEELVPWHILTSKCRSQLPSISKADMDWATATNRLPHKDGGVVSNLGWLRAEIRLRLTTQLMQQIFVPLPSSIMQGKQPHNLECGVYNLSKSALEDACRLIVGAQQETEAAQKSTDVKIIASNGHMKPWNTKKEVAITELVARFMDRMKHLDFELTRFDHSMSVLELRCQSYDFERLSVIQRLGKHHGPEFSISSMENRFAEAFANHGHSIKKCPPQRYVIALPMPRKLPESARCLSL